MEIHGSVKLEQNGMKKRDKNNMQTTSILPSTSWHIKSRDDSLHRTGYIIPGLGGKVSSG